MLTVPDCGERLKLTGLDDEISRSRGEGGAPSPSEDAISIPVTPFGMVGWESSVVRWGMWNY